MPPDEFKMAKNMYHRIIQAIHHRFLPSIWIFIFPPAALLSAELTFEETYLTWRFGPHLIGGFFAWVSPVVLIICIGAFYLCYAWLCAMMISSILNRSIPSRSDLIKISLTVFVLVLEQISINQWHSLYKFILG